VKDTQSNAASAGTETSHRQIDLTMRQQVAPQAGLSYSINDIGVIGRAMHVLGSREPSMNLVRANRIQTDDLPLPAARSGTSELTTRYCMFMRKGSARAR
jgi:hypothetical protein